MAILELAEYNALPKKAREIADGLFGWDACQFLVVRQSEGGQEVLAAYLFDLAGQKGIVIQDQIFQSRKVSDTEILEAIHGDTIGPLIVGFEN